MAASSTSTSEDIRKMFDRIAHRYDFLNRLLSFRRDVMWRKRVARYLPERPLHRMLDLATGTGDLLLAMCRGDTPVGLGVGVDLSEQMLAIAQGKIARAGLEHRVCVAQGHAGVLPFCNAVFDVVTMGFGIRNVDDVPGSLSEIHRVLKPGGCLIVLEFSLPQNGLFRAAYLLYLRYVVPRIGAFVSGDGHAYSYLRETIEAFPCGQAFCNLMSRAGFARVAAHPLTFGIATLYHGDKQSDWQ